jgi:2-amino-4-hydroxy-6-hydroxymethyldihydropteridine diphosphokinase
LSLGSNLGDREQHLNDAIKLLEQEKIHITAQSAIYETEPRDVTSQPWFLNIVAACDTQYFPLQFLKILQRIERDLGRVRNCETERRGPRPIDIDILLFGDTVLDTALLTVPHPRMLERRFVLEPLLEIAPDLKYPRTNKPLKSFLAAVATQKIRKRPV